MQSRPGVYALLLGSGVSAAAGVPTGWGVVLDLARRLAAARGEDAGDDPAAWHESTFGRSPDYSELVERLAATPAERLLLLRGYFEPTEQERGEGKKLPTDAHRAIARLAAGGYVRVIVTTNFDRLLEQALQAEGVAPLVVYTPDQVEGMLPLQHATAGGGVLVVKPHGDYLDTRLRNTAGELAAYEPPLRDLLDRIFAEYGLVACGWSGEWDPALRDCIERATRHRFATFWMARGGVGDPARQLVRHRQATVLAIQSADTAFADLERRVAAIAEVQATPPVDARVAVALVKRYLPDERDAIRLDDVVSAEVRAAAARLRAFDAGDNAGGGRDGFRRIVAAMEAWSAKLVPMAFVGGFFGSPRTDPLWVRAVRGLAVPALEQTGGLESLTQLRRYPALLCLYAHGVGLTAAGRFDRLRPLLADLRFDCDWAKAMPAAACLIPHRAFYRGSDELLLDGQDRPYSPAGRHIAAALRRLLDDVLPPEMSSPENLGTHRFGGFEEALGEYEFLQSAASAWLGQGPFLGDFTWRWFDRFRQQADGCPERLLEELRVSGSRHRYLAGGLFDGDPAVLQRIVGEMAAAAARQMI